MSSAGTPAGLAGPPKEGHKALHCGMGLETSKSAAQTATPHQARCTCGLSSSHLDAQSLFLGPS